MTCHPLGYMPRPAMAVSIVWFTALRDLPLNGSKRPVGFQRLVQRSVLCRSSLSVSHHPRSLMFQRTSDAVHAPERDQITAAFCLGLGCTRKDTITEPTLP